MIVNYSAVSITKPVSLPEIPGKKITLSYTPTTAEDEAVIESYIPDPGPDGTIDSKWFNKPEEGRYRR